VDSNIAYSCRKETLVDAAEEKGSGGAAVDRGLWYWSVRPLFFWLSLKRTQDSLLSFVTPVCQTVYVVSGRDDEGWNIRGGK
jgi:hypothetical protein